MKLPKIRIPKEVYRAGYFVKRNLPTILSIVGCIGVPATAVLSSIATLKAKKVLDEQPGDTTFMEDVKAVAKYYIPAVITGGAAMGSIVGANTINLQRNAALAAAGSALAARFMAYKERVKEVAGEEIAHEIDKKQAEELLEHAKHVGEFDESNLILYEPFTEQLIFTTAEKLESAKCDLNYNLQRDGSVTLSKFIKALGGDPTADSDMVGWDENNEIQYSLWYEWQGFAWIDIFTYDDEKDGMMVKYIQYGIEPMNPNDYPLYPNEDNPENYSEVDHCPFDVR